ncbi:hypothetical protein SS50377_22116 [Spironucleus salmonicida]|uniref:Uncharacterized protein n=1 Tax=Spironucleus salmonicida TaxID=348837 RepID=V6LY57_9EUKA|nr:hypothetical protein SS50377_22116 [Spironucleus salmonicida]|eukprot:EST45724.1 hypothetical protein SS50377_14296 [Spironucleus salmonicida]
MSKKMDIPADPDLRNEFFSKYAASTIYDAHIIIVYFDEQLSSESGLPSPFNIIRNPNFMEKRLQFAHFTSQKNAIDEFATEQEKSAQKPAQPAIVLYPELYYGLWGTLYNATSDAKPGEFYSQIEDFIEQVCDNFDDLKPANEKLEKEAKIQSNNNVQLMTTQTDGICARFMIDKQRSVSELQGSVKKFVCSKNCSKVPYEFDQGFRFPVKQNNEVEKVILRQGLDPEEGIPKVDTFMEKILNQYSQNIANPPKVRKVVTKKPAPVKKDDKKTKKTKKIILAPETYTKVWAQNFETFDQNVHVLNNKIESAKQTEIQPGCTHPYCPRCQGRLRFNILTTAVIAQAYKTWYVNLCKDMSKILPKEMSEIMTKRHNNFTPNPKGTQGKINTGLKTVILELGYNSTYSKIHQENIKSLVMGKGQTSLIRIGRTEDTLNLDFPNLEQFIQNTTQGADFTIEAQFYPIVMKKVVEGIQLVHRLFQDRSDWIADWDDLKKRTEMYGKKK